jgi:hypothetical protein
MNKFENTVVTIRIIIHLIHQQLIKLIHQNIYNFKFDMRCSFSTKLSELMLVIIIIIIMVICHCKYFLSSFVVIKKSKKKKKFHNIAR